MISTLEFFTAINNDFGFVGNISKEDFKQSKRIALCDLIANQPFVDPVEIKRKNRKKYWSTIYVLQYNRKMIVIDGHHTVCAMKEKGILTTSVKMFKYGQN